MATLIVWIATQDADNDCYNLVAKTKKECLRLIAENSHNSYNDPQKTVIHYKDAFDLFEYVTGEGGGRNPLCY